MRKFKKTLILMLLAILIPSYALSDTPLIKDSKKSSSPPEILKAQKSIKDYQRPAAGTYLIFPEWYIVYSSQEYANHLATKMPSEFPYFSSIGQYWHGYSTVDQMTKNRYPHDYGDHLMLYVIGTSFSGEYIFKSIYENSIGRLSEISSGHQFTAEDHYAQKVANQYAAFIPIYPWYDFSYAHSLKGLWLDTPFFGPHMFRKMERKSILSFEYTFKMLYASLIAAGTHLTYGDESQYVYALVENAPQNIFQQTPIKLVKKVNPTLQFIAIPGEQPFTDIVGKLANTPMVFENIAGNNEIVVSAIAPKKWNYTYPHGQLLFKMNILTQPHICRLTVRVPVNKLMEYLRYLHNNNLALEHIYE